MGSMSVKTKSRLTLLALLMVFVLPLLLAWALSVGPLEWRPQRTVNFGLLLDPPLQLQTYGVVNASGAELTSTAIARDWYVVVLHAKACSAACRNLTQAAEKIQLAVGRDARRVKLAILGHEKVLPASSKENWLLPADDRLISDLGRATVESQLDNVLLIVDYQGYVVLLYHSVEGGIGALEDLKRLLKAAAS